MDDANRDTATEPGELNSPPPPVPAPIQFGLRSIFVLTTIVAVVVTVLFAVPDPFATPAIGLLQVSWTSVLGQIVVFSRGHLRTFAIGAVMPATAALLVAVAITFNWITLLALEVSPSPDTSTYSSNLTNYFRYGIVISMLLSVLLGLFAFVTRWAVRGNK